MNSSGRACAAICAFSTSSACAGSRYCAQEHAQQVLGLERGDRRLDAVAGHVADDRGDPARRDAEHVVEVAGHEPGARLVDAADLEAGEVGQVVGREALGPAPRRELLLREHLLGPPLEHGPFLEQPRLADEVAPVDEVERDGHEDERVAASTALSCSLAAAASDATASTT